MSAPQVTSIATLSPSATVLVGVSVIAPTTMPRNSRTTFAKSPTDEVRPITLTFPSGAASGIGRATALAFGAEGGRVTVVDRSDKDGEATAKAIRDAGGAAIFFKADVSKAADCRAMVAAAVAAHGGLQC